MKILMMNVKQKLLERLKADVYIIYERDSLQVYIYGTIPYRTKISTIETRLALGQSSDTITDEITQSYKKYIFSTIFK